MFQIRTLNNISEKGLNRFARSDYELASEFVDPDAILVRSAKLGETDATASLVAVGRAGAGVNNIPVDQYTERGIVVFNTPGANANAVKELVMAGLLLSRRGIVPGVEYVRGLIATDKTELNSLVEDGKKQFKGTELKGRTLGVLGLGAIGSMVAEMALQMGMDVLGYDPALSVEAAWRLSSSVQKMENMQALFARSDMVTLHVPSLPATRGMLNDEAFSYFREGATLLNFARDDIVDNAALSNSLASGRLSQYISDFPVPELMGVEGIMFTPHLGASTDEAEENCAIMVAEQVIDFLEHGNIRNSVNFPAISLERTEGYRLALANRNVPRILGGVLSILADRNINVLDMLNKSREDVAYNLIDIDTAPSDELVSEIAALEGVVKVRTFDKV